MLSIYTWKNKINGKLYVGMTTTEPEDRKRSHLAAAKNPKFLIHKAIKKYGEENFEFNVIFNVFDEADLPVFEQIFIQEYRSCILDGHGYNMTRGGEGFDPETASKNNYLRVKNGTHPWSGPTGSETMKTRWQQPEFRSSISSLVSKAHKEKMEAGIHHFISEHHKNLVSEYQNMKVELGNHPFLKENMKEVTYPICGKTGKGGGMYKNHFTNCKKKGT